MDPLEQYRFHSGQLEVLANELLTLDGKGQHQKYSDSDLENVALIFMRVMGCRSFDALCEEDPSMAEEQAIQRFEKMGAELRKYIRKYTDVDLFNLVNQNVQGHR